LVLGLFTDNPTVKIVFFTIGMITQMFFWALEYSEDKKLGYKEYFKEGNWNDFTMPLIFGIHIFLYYHWKLYEPELQYKSLVYNGITIFTLFQAVVKTLLYVRVIDSFGFLVQMIISVFADLVPFLVIMLLFVCFFSLMVFVMGGQFDNGDYDGINV